MMQLAEGEPSSISHSREWAFLMGLQLFAILVKRPPFALLHTGNFSLQTSDRQKPDGGAAGEHPGR